METVTAAMGLSEGARETISAAVVNPGEAPDGILETRHSNFGRTGRTARWITGDCNKRLWASVGVVESSETGIRRPWHIPWVVSGRWRRMVGDTLFP
jgi:hypothetical protein